MRRLLTLALVGLAVFLVFLVARFPARWAEPWLSSVLPAGVGCERLGGTIWTGRCASLTVDGARLGDARWSLHPSRLLTGKLAASVALSGAAIDARGDVEVAPSGALAGRNIQAVVTLDPRLLPQAPQTLRGTIRADLDTVAVSGKTVTGIAGRIDALRLAQSGRTNVDLGDYSVTFPPNETPGEPVGSLVDLRGPLSVTGSLRLTNEPGFELEGLVAARPDAPPDLARQLQYLGRPDAAGRRPFSIAGTW